MALAFTNPGKWLNSCWAYWSSWYVPPLTFRRQDLRQLRENLASLELPDGNEVINIVLVGPMQAGKSSVINTLRTAIEETDRTHHINMARAADFTVTDRYKMTRLTDRIRIVDIPGVQPNGSVVTSQYIKDILDGKMIDFQQFDGENHATAPPANQRSKQIHAVFFIASSYLTPFGAMQANIEEWIRETKDRGIAWGILLTKIDTFCGKLEYDVGHFQKCRNLHPLVIKCKERYGIGMPQILFIRNYTDEIVPQKNIDIVALNFLLHAVNLAKDTLEYQTPVD